MEEVAHFEPLSWMAIQLTYSKQHKPYRAEDQPEPDFLNHDLMCLIHSWPSFPHTLSLGEACPAYP